MVTPNQLLGLPDGKFDRWYPGQFEALQSITAWLKNPDSRFMGAALPTGLGKSVLAVLAGTLGGTKTTVLTVSKELQDQATTDFPWSVDVRGQSNYPCRSLVEMGQHYSVAEGPCHDGGRCPYREEGGCAYYDRLEEARKATLTHTNYPAWVYVNAYGDGMKSSLLVCDEAHLAFKTVESIQQFDVTRRRLETWGEALPAADDWELAEWKEWAQAVIKRTPSYKKRGSRSRRELAKDMMKLSGLDDNWVVEPHWDGYSFVPVWVAPYTDQLFIKNVDKVLLTSATMTPKTMQLLGIQDFEWFESNQAYPPENTPIYWIPTIRLTAKTEHLGLWVSRMDQLVRDRGDRKGLILPVSYARANYYYQNSVHKDRLLIHDSKNREEVVAQFRETREPKVLVSPAVGTGYDFPGDQCRFIIVAKVPFPDTRGAAMKRRTAEDKDYLMHLTLTELVQECGRGTRSEGDWCEVFCCDDQWNWVFGRNKHLTPRWFQERVKGRHEGLPTPRRL